MTQRFTDRVAIVTGAGGGIGEAYARALHAEASVVIAELNKDAGAAVAADLGERACSSIPTSAISVVARRWPPPNGSVRRHRSPRQ